MAKPRAIIMTGYGINCEEETAYSFEKSGAETEIVHINDLIINPRKMDEFQIMALPGGFSYGDDTGSGNAYANKISNNLKTEIRAFAKKDKLIIGICNGFQILINLGLLPAVDDNYGQRQAALMHNIKARFECRWVHIKNTSKKCVWTENIDIMPAPVAHGEGNFFAEEKILKKMEENDQIVFKYVKPDGTPANNEYPYNPNGALNDIAAICDPSGRIFGIMPHPERFNSFTNFQGWPKLKEQLIREGKEIPKEGLGLQIYKNGVKYFT